MTNVGPGLVYGLFLLTAPFFVAIPILIISILLERRISSFPRALAYALLLTSSAYTAVGLGTGFTLETATLPATLSILYVASLAPGTIIVRGATGTDWNHSLRRGTEGWVAAHLLLLIIGVIALPIAGAPSLVELLVETPPLLGIAGLTGYLAYSATVAFAAGIIGIVIERH